MSFVASSIKQKFRGIVDGGFREVHFVAQFTSTNASGDMDCLLGTIEGYSIDSIGPVNTDEKLYLDELASFGDGVVKKPIDGKLTFTRTGTATSGLVICGRYWGF